MFLTFALQTMVWTATAAEAGCTPAHLQHCAAHLGRLTNEEPMGAYREARAAADGIVQAGRIYSASELGEFYGAASVVATRARMSKETRQAGDPTDAQLESDTLGWAQMRCRVGSGAPWPIFVGALEREVLDARCSVQPSVSQVAPRLLWIDGTPVEAGTSRAVEQGMHVVQFMDGAKVTTTLTVFDEKTVDFGGIAPSVQLRATKRPSNSMRLPLAIGGTALIGLGTAGLLIWGSELTPSLAENADEEVLLSALSLLGIGLGSAGVFGGVLLTSSGPVVGVGVPL